MEAASYVVDSLQAMRELQERLDLPLSTAAQVLTGIRLTAGSQPVFTSASVEWIEQFVASRWLGEDMEALGAEWADRVREALRADRPSETGDA